MPKKKINEEFVREVFDLVGDEYIFLDEYVNNSTKIEVIHNICGNKYTIRPTNFISGQRCKKCHIKNIKENGISTRKSHEKFVDEVKELGNEEYEVISRYVKDNENIIMKHIKCGNEYPVKPTKFIQGQRCPKCKKSKGEVAISKILKDNNVRFEEQYRFEDCRNKSPLPFDFAILGDNDSVEMLIEFQGVQHFKPVGFLGGEERFNYTKNNDLIKSNYCKSNNIPLLAISYLDFNRLEFIIKNTLRR